MSKTGIVIFILILQGFVVRGQDFFKTPSGAKYHLGTCHMVKNVSEKITLGEAEKLGLGPCGICHPATRSQSLVQKQTAAGSSATTRCRGYTKKGTQCQHMTSIANGYCFQHKPKD